MQSWVLILLVVLSSTLLWPVNCWAARNRARPEEIGIVGSLVGIPLAIVLGLGMHSPLLAHRALLIGAVGGVAYAVGFVLIIFYCLRIGPTGPTVTLNNMGLVWPVLIGLLWFSASAPTVPQWAGFGCTLLALALTGANRSKDESVTPITARWAGWALVGWAFAGISMSCQYLDSQLAPNTPYAYLLASFSVALVICLGIAAVKRTSPPHLGRPGWTASPDPFSPMRGGVACCVCVTDNNSFRSYLSKEKREIAHNKEQPAPRKSHRSLPLSSGRGGRGRPSILAVRGEGETQQRNRFPTRVEFLAGLGVGAINVLSITLTILLLGPLHVSPAIVMPVTVAGPVIIMLLIGHFVLKERLNPLGWTASALGVAGIICLTLPR